MQRRIARQWMPILLSLLLAALISPVGASAAPAQKHTGTYTNPLKPQIPGDGLVESCADPSIIRGQVPNDPFWYVYCTKDPLNGADRNAAGQFIFHNIPILRSLDLVHWTYMGDVFPQGDIPSWIAPNAGLFAPSIEYFNNTYYLYYSVTDTAAPLTGSAIGVATGPTPLGPWADKGAPVVEPTEAFCCPGSRRATIDPEVIEVAGLKYIFYGSYFGGISARELSLDGLTSNSATQKQITIDNRYEGPYIVKRGNYYYLFVSATDCCRGPLTGYTVFAGRSTNLLGPYVDKQGISLLDARVGGTPVLSMNGNRWVGPGHNAVFQDFDGQWWTVYHAIDRNDPYFEGAPGFTRRPLMLDAIDWVGGWPTVRGGQWVSDTPQQAPAGQPGDKTNYKTKLAKDDRPGHLIKSLSDEFSSAMLSPQWSWVRQPASGYGVETGAFRFDTQNGDLFVDSNNAPVLTELAPHGNYIVEVKVTLNMPVDKCGSDCRFVQAGLVIYGDDDNFIKLVDVAIFNTRQSEFAKELAPVPTGYPRYGNTVVGPPGETTWLRIVKRTHASEELYTAYTSNDGEVWVRGGTWTHNLGTDARIGLVSMGGSGFVAKFDYVRVYQVRH
jgi:arabinan endo-1,5-alpha-L-arabinosidase